MGNYDGLPRSVVAKAIVAGAAVMSRPFEVAFDRVTSFAGGDGSVWRRRRRWHSDVSSRLGRRHAEVWVKRGFAIHTAHHAVVRTSPDRRAIHRTYSLDRSRLCPCAQLAWQNDAYSARTVASWRVTFFAIASGQHDEKRDNLRHQELRDHEQGARLARQARRRLCVSRLQDRGHRPRAAGDAGARRSAGKPCSTAPA